MAEIQGSVAETEQYIEELEKRIGAPIGFVKRLQDEDDWSFIIKLCALFEAATIHILNRALGDGKLSKLFAAMPIQGRVSKLAAIAALDLLPQTHIHIIDHVREIRNHAAHRISHVALDLNDYHQRLGIDKVKNLLRNVEIDPDLQIVDGDKIIFANTDFYCQRAKQTIWEFGVIVLEYVYLADENIATGKQYDAMLKRIGRIYESQFFKDYEEFQATRNTTHVRTD